MKYYLSSSPFVYPYRTIFKLNILNKKIVGRASWKLGLPCRKCIQMFSLKIKTNTTGTFRVWCTESRFSAHRLVLWIKEIWIFRCFESWYPVEPSHLGAGPWITISVWLHCHLVVRGTGLLIEVDDFQVSGDLIKEVFLCKSKRDFYSRWLQRPNKSCHLSFLMCSFAKASWFPLIKISGICILRWGIKGAGYLKNKDGSVFSRRPSAFLNGSLDPFHDFKTESPLPHRRGIGYLPFVWPHGSENTLTEVTMPFWLSQAWDNEQQTIGDTSYTTSSSELPLEKELLGEGGNQFCGSSACPKSQNKDHPRRWLKILPSQGKKSVDASRGDTGPSSSGCSKQSWDMKSSSYFNKSFI